MIIINAGLAAPPGKPNLSRADTIRAAAMRYWVNHATIYKAFFIAQRDKEFTRGVLQGELSVGPAEVKIRTRTEGARVPPVWCGPGPGACSQGLVLLLEILHTFRQLAVRRGGNQGQQG